MLESQQYSNATNLDIFNSLFVWRSGPRNTLEAKNNQHNDRVIFLRRVLINVVHVGRSLHIRQQIGPKILKLSQTGLY